MIPIKIQAGVDALGNFSSVVLGELWKRSWLGRVGK
ncbi:hypothetical protein MTYM_02130 [Methylococcales bacterium]|nr:hypothetical protein MTYM_02130 [Methylococcales bacterium]